jgi:hypothetical protein
MSSGVGPHGEGSVPNLVASASVDDDSVAVGVGPASTLSAARGSPRVPHDASSRTAAIVAPTIARTLHDPS